jgi:hypothetical protein
MLGAGIMAGGLGSLVHHRLQKDDGTSCVLGSLPLGGPLAARIGVLLPESNLRRRLPAAAPFHSWPAPGSTGVIATWFPAVFGRRDFVQKKKWLGREWAMLRG